MLKKSAHNNKTQICFCGQISLQSAAVNWSFSDTILGTIYFAGDITTAQKLSFVIGLKNIWFIPG